MAKSKLTKQAGLRFEESVDADLTKLSDNNGTSRSWEANQILTDHFKKHGVGKR